MLGGVNYPNNSVIQFDSIYYTPNHCSSLLCTTDQVPCCSNPLNGNWYNVQPNGSFINIPNLSSSQNDYYQSRENDGTVRLFRQAGVTQSTDSVYCCQLLDATLTIQTLCVTIGELYCIKLMLHNIMHKFCSSTLSWCVVVVRWPVRT